MADLKRQLQEAERAIAVSEVANRLHGIELPQKPKKTHLGPVVIAEVQVEGVSTQALLDTGSPVTIVDLDFVVQALAENCEKHVTPIECMSAVEQRFQVPEVPLKSYGGEELNLVGQTKVVLSRCNYSTEATIQVQKDAPVKLLIGTDMQPQLGFAFVMQYEGQVTDLLKQEPWQGDCVVRLVKATHLPANHMKMVKVQALGVEGRSLFQPVREMIECHGLQMVDAIVEPDEGGHMTPVVENHGSQPVDLEDLCVLGYLHSVERVIPDDRVQKKRKRTVQYAVTDWTPPQDKNSDRAARVLEAVGLNKSQLTQEEQNQLVSLICEYQDLFALESADLGTTELVTHSIYTGDQPPIRQPLRRTPFALREKMAEMVEDMLQRGVIKPLQSPWASPVVLVEKKDKSL